MPDQVAEGTKRLFGLFVPMAPGEKTDSIIHH
jgi:hypothetical protein